MIDPPHAPAEEQRELPSVSVVVPVRDSPEDLRRCVAALLAQDYPEDLLDIVVADNGSARPPQGILPRTPRLQVLSEPRPGSYQARNAALAVARGEVIAFTDADCTPHPTWVRRGVAALDTAPAADAVGGAVHLVFAGGRPRTGAEWYEYLHAFPQEDYVRRGFSVTANLLTRRTVVDRIGLFDTTLESGGDAEWGRRLVAQGGHLRYAPSAVVDHPARASRREVIVKARRTTTGVAARRLRRPRGRAVLVRMLLGQVRSVVRCTATVWFWRQPDSMRARLAYLRVSWGVSRSVIACLVRALFGRGGS